MIEVLKEKDEKNYWKRIDKKQKERKLYKLKLKTIQNCLYGVDIEPSAIDITKLRLWLSIIVDSDNNNVRPLPNLDFNFMIGNSLIDEFEGMKLFDETLLNDKVLKKEISKGKIGQQKSLLGSESIKQGILEDIFSKQARFFNEKNLENKKKLKNEIEKLEISLIKFTLEVNQNLSKLNEIEKGRKERRKPYFLWKLEFAKVFRENGGFDIVIGNPPYVGEGKKKEIFIPVQKTSFGEKYYIGKMDFWYFFTSLGIELLKENGTLSYIAPNNWTTTAGGKKMRNHIMKEMVIKEFIDFGDYMVFENAMQQTMIFLLQKNKNLKNNVKIAKVLDKTNFKYTEFFNRIEQDKNYSYYISGLNREEYKEDDIIVFLNLTLKYILDKLKIGTITLKKDEIAQGIVSPQDFLNKENSIKLNRKIGEGIFVLNSDEIKEKNFLENEIKDLIRPYYTTDELKKYALISKNKYWIIYTKSSIKENIENYPKIKEHLNIYSEIITSDNKPYGLHRARDEKFFQGEKIISLRKCVKEPIFTYCKEDCYVPQTFFSIKTDRFNMKYLTGLLNSKLIAFWLRYMGKMQGSNYQIDKEPLMNIPIKIASNEIEEKIINLVERIVELKKLDKDTQDLENQIDEMVYGLYELTEEEKDLVREF